MIDLDYHPFAADLIFGEGMRWYGNRLWMSDMLGRRVYRYDETGVRETIATVQPRPNGLGFLPDGRLIITSMADQRLLVRGHDGGLSVYADLSGIMTGYCGDMAVDTAGRVYLDDVGFRVFEGEARRPGTLLRIDPDGATRVLRDQLAFPNGMWITQDNTRLIFAEGRAQNLFSYTLAANGDIVDETVFARLPNPVLDGLVLDAADAVWQCCPHDKEVLRVTAGGQVTHRVRMDLQPVACCLGGADFRTLYVVAADYTLESMARDESTAAIFRLRVDTPGFALPGDR